jgi:hypothetical protein
MSFFINPPLAMLSGAMSPIEAMPDWLQPLTVINPVRHFATICPRNNAQRGRGRRALSEPVGIDVVRGAAGWYQRLAIQETAWLRGAMRRSGDGAMGR